MAFNFNWSPLIADTSRAREMLTSALNKSPKPPIIVDDIIVTELNLGSVPPELEILEIGDLAEDRFRGIFKMSYRGDAFLTLKTRVQANPLNTYLASKPAFASPLPLAASSGLTIPLQITLSDIRLSGFVILVFSKQKGITLVFRNDPLEALKVSSTFDSIPFVRNYLQKEIEGQLRILFMDDLPAIIHRLSLRIWSPDSQHAGSDESLVDTNAGEKDNAVRFNPLASPSQSAYDSSGQPIDESDMVSLSSDHPSQSHANFSQKNLLRLAALTDSYQTLSLFTPPLRDVVHRAWAGSAERGERGEVVSGNPLGLGHLQLSRRQSAASSVSGSVMSHSESVGGGSISSRPSLSTMTSAYSFGSGGARGRSHLNRKRKHRVVNLRGERKTETVDAEAAQISRPTTPTTTTSSRETTSGYEEGEGELVTPPDSPEKKTPRPRHSSLHMESTPLEMHSPKPRVASNKLHRLMESPPELQEATTPSSQAASRLWSDEQGSSKHDDWGFSSQNTVRPPHRRVVQRHTPWSNSPSPTTISPSAVPTPGAGGSILEQAWMMKMANEIARRVQQEKEEQAAAATVARSGGSAAAGVPRAPTTGMSFAQKADFWASRDAVAGGRGAARAHASSDDADEESSRAPPPAYAA